MKRLSMIVAAIAMLAGVQQASAEYASSSLNLRSGPGTNYGVIAVIPYCGQVSIYNRNYGWCQVNWNNYSGWVSCRYLVSYCGGGGYSGGGYSGGGYSGGGYSGGY